jgi:hypothetical protein
MWTGRRWRSGRSGAGVLVALARAGLHSHISRLRRVFAGALTIVHRSDGYTLVADEVDLLQFWALRDRAAGTDDVRMVALLAGALALWRVDAG